jgi:hypothetical protein
MEQANIRILCLNESILLLVRVSVKILIIYYPSRLSRFRSTYKIVTIVCLG